MFFPLLLLSLQPAAVLARQDAQQTATAVPSATPSALDEFEVHIKTSAEIKKDYKWFSRVIPFSKERQVNQELTFAEAIQDGLIWGVLWDGAIAFAATLLYHTSGYHFPTWMTSMIGVQIEWFTWANVGVQAMQGMFYGLLFVVGIKVVRTIIYSFENERHFLESPKYADNWEGDIIYYEGVRRSDIDHLFGLTLLNEVDKTEDFQSVGHLRYFVHNGNNMNYMATAGRKYKTTIYTDLMLPSEYPLKGKHFRLQFIGLKDDGTRYNFHVSHRFGFRKEYRPYFQEREVILAKGLQNFLNSPVEFDISKVKEKKTAKSKFSVTVPADWNGETIDISGPDKKSLERIFRLTVVQGDMENPKAADPVRVGNVFFFMRRPEEGGGLFGGGAFSVNAATAVVLSTNSPPENLYLVIEKLDDEGKTEIVHVSNKFNMQRHFTNFFLARNRVMSKGLENLLLSGASQTMEDAIETIKSGKEMAVGGDKASAIMSREGPAVKTKLEIEKVQQGPKEKVNENKVQSAEEKKKVAEKPNAL